MTLLQLKCFLAVSQAMNFTRAAVSLYITQSHLSKQIAALERELGVRLFQRNSHGVCLTREGAFLAQRLQGIPEQVEAAVAALPSLEEHMRGVVRLGVLDHQVLGELPTRQLQAFTSRYPQVQLLQERQDSIRLRDGLQSGAYDIITLVQEDMEHMPGVSFRKLSCCPVALILHKSHPMFGRPELKPEDLAQHPFALLDYSLSPALFDRAMHLFRGRRMAPPVLKMPSYSALALQVETGLSATIMDTNATFCTDQTFRTIPLPDVPPVQYVMAWRTDNRRTEVAALLAMG